MIRAAWESPTNEGTSYFEIGRKHRQIPKTYTTACGDYEYEWEVGRIILDERWDGDFGARIIVMDTNGDRRVSLPAATCAWEWLPQEEEEDDA